MKSKIINYLDAGRIQEIIEYIFADNNLESNDKLVLILLFNQAKDQLPEVKSIADMSSLTQEKVKSTLNNLIKHNWCNLKY